MKIRAVVFEVIASRQTDKRGGGLCFIIVCIDIDYCPESEISGSLKNFKSEKIGF